YRRARRSVTSLSGQEYRSAVDPNDRQWRLINFAVRKSCTYDIDPEDATVVIRALDGSGSRRLVLYRAGATGNGMRVLLHDRDGSGRRETITATAAYELL